MAYNVEGFNSNNSVLSGPYAYGIEAANIRTSVSNNTTATGPMVAIDPLAKTVSIPEDVTIMIGEDFRMSALEFKTCMKLLRKMAMEEIPEDYI